MEELSHYSAEETVRKVLRQELLQAIEKHNPAVIPSIWLLHVRYTTRTGIIM